jgi:triacylglycerol lipase
MLIYDYPEKIPYNTTQQITDPTDLLSNLSTYAPNGRVLLFIDDKKSGLQAAITKSSEQKRLCVVFRGSQERADWSHNKLFRKRPIYRDGDATVHRGFYKQLVNNGHFTTIVGKLQREIDDNPNYEIFVLGHSLGASLGTIFGFLFSNLTEHLVTLVTFGSPRVGNKQFKQQFENQSNLIHYRITNQRDIATAFPIVGYHHVGKHIHIEKNRFKRGRVHTIFNSWSLQDHKMISYYNNFKRAKCWSAL